jgi:hypothetical protein
MLNVNSMGSDTRLTNCIFWGNSAPTGPQMYNILVGSLDPAIVTYSVVQVGYPGLGNIVDDPLFVRNPDDGGDGWGDDPATPGVDEGANDDFGDLRLQAGSPCIDAGNNFAVPADTADLDDDDDRIEQIPFDLDGRPRFIDDPSKADSGNGTAPIVDMGAYESIWDTDRDGIEEPIDTEPDNYSNDFSDGVTSGTITPPRGRGDQFLTITDEPDPRGVRIKASPGGGAIPATVIVCGDEYTLNSGDVAGDDEGIVTCGSAAIEVISGIIEITFVPDAGPAATTSLAAGNSLTFDKTTFTITAPSTNPDVVVLLVEGEEFSLAPGESLTFNQPPVADAGDDQTVEQESYAGTEVTLDGSASTDPDSSPGTNDDIVAFDWYEGVTLLGSGEVITYTFPLGSHTVTLTVTDSYGETDANEVVIVVQDTTPPEITCPADVILECPADTAPSATGEATATDNCDDAPAITYSDTCELGCGGTKTCWRTWTATDESGNSSTCVQTITVVDTTPPVISCPSDLTLECDGSGNTAQISSWLASATASDTCSSAAITNDFSSLSDGCGATGTATVTWTAVDDCGNSASCSATVRVIDTTPPIITCPADVTLECPADTAPSVTGEATATDTCGDVTITYSDVSVPGPGNTETITRTWTATDECGNSSSCVQTIAVVDTTPPTIHSVSASPNILWPPNHKMVEVTVTVDAVDICDPAPVCNIVNVTSNEPINGQGDGNTEPDWELTGDLTVNLRAERAGGGTGRVYTLHIECTDASDNTIAATVEVTVPHDQGKGKK